MIRYKCGAARQFKKEDGTPQELITMICQWNKTWTPSNHLLVKNAKFEEIKNILKAYQVLKCNKTIYHAGM